MKWIGLLVVVSIALAQEGKKENQEVKAIGCVRQGVEAGCLLLRTMDGKTTYNIFATPRPELETVIAIEGKPHRGPTACMEGVAIDVTKWERSEQKCSEAVAENPWDKVKELKSGTELRIYKKGVPILAAMDEATDDRLLVVVKNEQMAIDRDDIERVDARARSSRVTKETRTTMDTTSNPPSVGPQPRGSRPGAPGSSSGASYGVGSKPDFETVYRRPR